MSQESHRADGHTFGRYFRSRSIVIGAAAIMLAIVSYAIYARTFPQVAGSVEARFAAKLATGGNWKDIQWMMCVPREPKAKVAATLSHGGSTYRFVADMLGSDYTGVLVYPDDDPAKRAAATKDPVAIYDFFADQTKVRRDWLPREHRGWVRNAAEVMAKALNRSV